MATLCIYHGNCADGFTAAWIVRSYLGPGIEFHAGVYGAPPPDVRGRDVVIVDFSYKRDVLEEIARAASTVTVLDHHKTAAADLEVFAKFSGDHRELDMDFRQFRNHSDFAGTLPIRALFDMNRSGARIAWDYFYPGKKPPRLVDHVEDRDLWRFWLPETRAVQANLFSYPYDFSVWQTLADDLEVDYPRKLFVRDGESIERKHFKDIAELLEVVTRVMNIGGYLVPIANLPYTFSSDAGQILARGKGTDAKPDHPFAGCYYDTPGGRCFGLRSSAGGLDVGEIASKYGGGGHRNAAGFRLPYLEAAKLEVQ